jgi:tetratricopeptide (TPR) repeat protein
MGLMYRLLLSTAIAIVSASAPLLADDERDCFQNKDPQVRIKVCSDIIQRDPNDATAYHNRAVAYGANGEIDRAIADYTKAIELTPDNAAAYDNRGRAYASKGDYTHAIADVTKASELVAKATAPGVVAPRPPAAAAIPPKAAAISPKAAATLPKAATMPAKAATLSTKTAPTQAKAAPTPRASNGAAKEAPADGWPAWASFRDKSGD